MRTIKAVVIVTALILSLTAGVWFFLREALELLSVCVAYLIAAILYVYNLCFAGAVSVFPPILGFVIGLPWLILRALGRYFSSGLPKKIARALVWVFVPPPWRRPIKSFQMRVKEKVKNFRANFVRGVNHRVRSKYLRLIIILLFSLIATVVVSLIMGFLVVVVEIPDILWKWIVKVGEFIGNLNFRIMAWKSITTGCGKIFGKMPNFQEKYEDWRDIYFRRCIKIRKFFSRQVQIIIKFSHSFVLELEALIKMANDKYDRPTS